MTALDLAAVRAALAKSDSAIEEIDRLATLLVSANAADAIRSLVEEVRRLRAALANATAVERERCAGIVEAEAAKLKQSAASLPCQQQRYREQDAVCANELALAAKRVRSGK